MRQQKVRLNQRTRQVRASDLAELTPIVDPASAITSEEGPLDLKSIPVQQREIRAAQQQLFILVTDIHEEVVAQIADVQQQAEQQATTIRQMLAEQECRQQKAFLELRETLTGSFRQQEETISFLQRGLDAARTELRQDDERLREDLAGQIAQQHQALMGYQTEISVRHSDYQQSF